MSPVISWEIIDYPYIASLSLNQTDLTKTAWVTGKSPGEAKIKASTGVAGSQMVCRNSETATVKVLDMNGTWQHRETQQFSNCPSNPLEVGICTVTQTDIYCGAAHYTGSFTGPTFSWVLTGSYELYPNVWLVSGSSISGKVDDDGLHYSAIGYWGVYYYYVDENGNGIWQYCSGYSTARRTRL